jgi:carboxyl-terminal processing protease
MEFSSESVSYSVSSQPRRPSFFRNAIFAILLLILGGLAGYRFREMKGGLTDGLGAQQYIKLQNTNQPTEFKTISFQQFWDVWKLLEQNYVDPSKLQTDQMVYGAIKGMTSSLGDPYTIYLPPSDQKRTEEDLHGSFYGVGIELGFIDNVPAVMSVITAMPADKAGIQAKDLILHIKDEAKKIDKDTASMNLNDVVNDIRGDRGTNVTLTLYRKDVKDKAPYTVTLQRSEIVVPSVKIAYEEGNGKRYAHITLSKFGERTQMEMNAIIQEIQKQSPKVDGVILDMRNNPGGLLDVAVNVASEFIKNGLIVTQKGRFASKDYNVVGTARLASYPLVVIVNGGSASASEIVAGALRDRRDAELIGEKSFGKGTVQDAMQLDSGAGLHVTVAKWLLPKGDWINQTGIPVNVEIKDDTNTPADEVIQKAVEELGKK